MHKLQTVIDQLRDPSHLPTRTFCLFAADLIEAEMERLTKLPKEIIAGIVNASPLPETDPFVSPRTGWEA